MFCSYCCQFEMKCVEFILTETVTRSAQQWNIYELTTQQIWTTLKTTEFVIRFLAVLHFTVCHTSLDLRVMKGRNKVDNSVQDQQSDRLVVIYLSTMTCVATKWRLFRDMPCYKMAVIQFAPVSLRNAFFKFRHLLIFYPYTKYIAFKCYCNFNMKLTSILFCIIFLLISCVGLVLITFTFSTFRCFRVFVRSTH